MAVALAAACILAAWQGHWKFPLSWAVLALLVLSLVPWLQWSSGIIPQTGQAFISSAYIAGFALAFALGSGAGVHQDRLLTIFFAALLLASALNVPVQIIQWFQWYSDQIDSILMILVTPINPAHRPSGFILQPNQLATIHVWGLIGATWLLYRGCISRWTFVASGLIIGIGLGLTQSRAGFLEILFVALILSWGCRSGHRIWVVGWWWALVGFQLLWALNFGLVVEWLSVPTEATARLSSIDGARIDAWRAFIAAVVQRPLAGFGVGDLGYAYTTLATERPDLYIGQRFAHSHNLIIDMALWFGAPLALILLALICRWSIGVLGVVSTNEKLIYPVASLGAFGIHSMLELPHHFLYFLVPVGVFAGALQLHAGGRLILFSRAVWVVAGAIILACASAVSYDYFPYQERYTEWRFEHARVGERPDVEVRPPILLDQIHDEMALYRLSYDKPFDSADLDWIRRAASAVASPPGYYAAAKAFALSGQHAAAVDWMMRLNAIMGADLVTTVQSIWRNDQRSFPALRQIDWPPYRGKTGTVQFELSDPKGELPLQGAER